MTTQICVVFRMSEEPTDTGIWYDVPKPCNKTNMKSRRAIHTLPFLHPTDRQTSRHRQRRQIHQRIRRAQPVHKRVLLHPASVMCLLVAGVFIAGWTLHAAAASYGVTAKVPAPPLTDGAVIT